MEKINIAELLKDCPKGMELDCILFENLEFDSIKEYDGTCLIICRVKTEFGYNVHVFTEQGCYSSQEYSKCVIYPKGKTTWEGFQRPFKDGDIVVYDNPYRNHLQVFIFKNKEENNTLSSCYLMLDGDELDLEEGMYYITRLAIEEEKQKLFDAIKANGYKWNAETKTLEKLIEPKFKAGDIIKNKNSGICDRVIKIFEDCYLVESCLDEQATIDFDIQDNWELFPNKFDITTLKPFDKVLTRTTNGDVWGADLFGWYKDGWFLCNGHIGFRQCIPYKENEHLLGTTNDCDDFYKTW